MLESLRGSNGLALKTLEQHKEDVALDWQSWNLEAMAFNMPFTGTNAVLGRMHATNIHAYACRDAQFIVSVYVHPLINHVFSVQSALSSVLTYSGHRCVCRYGSIMA